jgi:nicotinate-nucleotide pyrophosphorylase (carboxylating)
MATLRAAGLEPDDTEWIVRRALTEDFRYGPDITSLATAPEGTVVTGDVVSRAHGVVAGLAVALAVAELAADAGYVQGAGDERAGGGGNGGSGGNSGGDGNGGKGGGGRAIEAIALRGDGDRIAPGDAVLRVSGPAAAVLGVERTMLNFLTRLSGIASTTRAWVDAVEGTGAQIRDTRKTTPGLRLLEKYAVRCGGGVNHRMGLGDAALIKDNHVAAAGGVAKAIEAIRAHAPEVPLEVECDTLAEVRESLEAGARFILLDNMSADELRAAVAVARGFPGIRLEASGGLRLETARAVALCGVDYLAVGALTHSSPALDLGLDFTN